MATVCGKFLVEMEKAWNLWVEDMNITCVPIILMFCFIISYLIVFMCLTFKLNVLVGVCEQGKAWYT